MKRARGGQLLQRVGGTVTFEVYLRADVPEQIQPRYANPNERSIWPNASDEVQLAIQEGRITERLDVLTVETSGTMANRRTQVRAAAKIALDAFQAEITALGDWDFEDTEYDPDTDTWV